MGFFRNLFKRISDVKKQNLFKEIKDLERKVRYYKAEIDRLERRQTHLLGIEGKGVLYNPTTYLQSFIDEYKEKVKAVELVLEQKRRKFELM